MRVCYFSDLHLEHYDYDIKFPEADILLLAGDICHAADLADWRSNADRMDRRDHALWFFDEALERYKNIIYCMGNHEHFDFDFYSTCSALRQELPDEITILDKEYTEIDGIIFFGATLWTDFKGGNLAEIEAAKRKMPEYKYVMAGSRELDPETVMRDHELALRNLSFIARENRDRALVVVTHHSPSPLGLNDTICNNDLQGAFASDLHDFILQHSNIRHWIFGHTHMQKQFEIGDCRLATNCRGYRDFEPLALVFSPEKSFDIKETISSPA